MSNKENIIPKQNKLQHVAVIMDGNGRWATRNGVEKIDGHTAGVKSLKSTVIAAQRCGVKYLTVYAFSTENWGRPKEEVMALMELFSHITLKEAEALSKHSIRLDFIGNEQELSDGLRVEIEKARSIEIEEVKMTLVVAMNYSARWDIVNAANLAAQEAAQEVAQGGLGEVTEELFVSKLSTCKLPDVDLVIRTSSEQRLSNFLLWESSYAELYFTDKLWPDFSEEDFEEAVEWFDNRKRRFGVR